MIKTVYELFASAFAKVPCELNRFLKSESNAIHMLTHMKAPRTTRLRKIMLSPRKIAFYW